VADSFGGVRHTLALPTSQITNFPREWKMNRTVEFQKIAPSKVIELPIRTYTATIRQHPDTSQLAADYDKLASIYDELAAELADYVWLPLENEALLQYRAFPETR